MKFFHLSDLHIGKQLHGYNLLEDQKYMMEQILQAAEKEQPDALVLAGDIYDKSIPSGESVTLFDEFLTEFSVRFPDIAVLLISGNHDSAERIHYASRLLENQKIYIAGRILAERSENIMKKVTFQDAHGEVHFYLLPFIKPAHVSGLFAGEGEEEQAPHSYEEAVRRVIEAGEIDYTKRNVLVAHQFFTGKGVEVEKSDSEVITVGGQDNVDISCVKDFDYVALGHIHGKQSVGSLHIRYCGTPLKYSVSERNHEKSIAVVEMKEKGKLVQREIPFKPLRDVLQLEGTLEELTQGEDVREIGQNNYVSIIVTDEEEPYNVKGRLDAVYPYLLEWKLKNVKSMGEVADIEDEEELPDPINLFAKFFEEMNGKELSDEQKEVMQQIGGSL